MDESRESTESRAAIAAAQEAAMVGDFRLAERHLREAATLQEAEHGPLHPDLANTFNNLGVACERAGRPDEAEVAYRRAYNIVVCSLPPGDEIRTRSEENLRDFCLARERPFDLPTSGATEGPTAAGTLNQVTISTPASTAAPSTTISEPIDPAAHPLRASPSAGAPLDGPATTDPVRRSLVVAAVIVLIVGLAASWSWFQRVPETSEATTTQERSSTQPQTPPAVDPPPSPPAPAPAVSSAAANDAAAVDVVEPSAVPVPAPPPVTSVVGSVRMIAAAMCGTFTPQGAEWRCESVGDEVSPGRSLVFYTRVSSPRATTVEHVWYRDDVVHQRVELRIAANPAAGYRTYSRTTVGAGGWRVELRAGQTLLHTEPFTVR